MLDGVPIKDLSIATLLGIAVLLVFIGRLIPYPRYKEKVQEAADWKKAYEKSEEARAIESAQKAELLELARTTRDILHAMFDVVTEDPRQAGGRHRVAVPPR